MSSQLEIIYLHHSGFVVETSDNVLVFDYYRDPAACLANKLQAGKKVWVFSSHSHEDHFNPAIGKWQQNVDTYILSDDIRSAGGLSGVSPAKIIYLSPYETKKIGPLQVSTYGSTDLGVSFLVEVDGWRLFHAGDLNWWHWPDDTPAEEKAAADSFKQELARLAGVQLDIAFFPVDSRLEHLRTLGAEEFCRQTAIRQLVAMHNCGEIWQPPAVFPGNDGNVSIWCPAAPGAALTLER